ncbi:hypothetical protein YPPY96_4133, partial [Yersinia pestis PY-96]
MHCLMNA